MVENKSGTVTVTFTVPRAALDRATRACDEATRALGAVWSTGRTSPERFWEHAAASRELVGALNELRRSITGGPDVLLLIVALGYAMDSALSTARSHGQRGDELADAIEDGAS